MEIIHLSKVGSTNTEAASRIAAGAIAVPTVIYADSQTAGKGSRGRNWESRIGNVTASYIVPLRGLNRPLQWLVHCCALATRQTLLDAGVTQRIDLKWPNDVLVEDRKISGSLHVSQHHRQEAFLVAGIAINALWHPESDGALFPPTSLPEWINEVPDHHTLVRGLFGRILNRVETYRAHGHKPIRDDYMAHMWRLGDKLGISLDQQKNTRVEGINRGLADDGSLLLETQNGIQQIHVGDVFQLD